MNIRKLLFVLVLSLSALHATAQQYEETCETVQLPGFFFWDITFSVFSDSWIEPAQSFGFFNVVPQLVIVHVPFFICHMEPVGVPDPTQADLDAIISGTFNVTIPGSTSTEVVPLVDGASTSDTGNYELVFNFCGTNCTSQKLYENGSLILNSTSAQSYFITDKEPGTYTYDVEQCGVEYLPLPELFVPYCNFNTRTVTVLASPEKTVVSTHGPSLSWPVNGTCEAGLMLVSGGGNGLCVEYTEINPAQLASYGPAALNPMVVATGIPGVAVGGIVILAGATLYCSLAEAAGGAVCDEIFDLFSLIVQLGIELLAIPQGLFDEPSNYVLRFRAPTQEQLEVDVAANFSGHTNGLYLTKDTFIARDWALNRQTGVYVFKTPASTYQSMETSGQIVPDPDPSYSQHSVVVVAPSIAPFVNASTVYFVPVDSEAFYDHFY